MTRITFFRIIRNGFLNYRRNFWLSVAATVIMVITLFMISSLLILNSIGRISLQTLEKKVDISVYFRLGTSEQTIRQIQRQVELLPEVETIDYIPSVTARDRFVELHQNEPLLLESVEQFTDQENPFPASFAIRVKNLNDYPEIINLFQNSKFDPFIKKITDKRNVVQQLSDIIAGLGNLGLGLTLIFSAITVLVMFNTIRLTIFNRRDEIEIMRLVGASNSYIRGPFIIEGLLYGIVGTVITSSLFLPILLLLMPKISSFFELNFSGPGSLGFNIGELILIQLVLGGFLGMLSSTVVIRRYLKI